MYSVPNVMFAKFKGVRWENLVVSVIRCIKDFVFVTNPVSENPLGKY